MVRRVAHRQFDVFRNPFAEDRDATPYLIVLQANAIDHFGTQVVAPLVPPSPVQMRERVLPKVTVEGEAYAIMVPNMMAISTKYIGQPVANLETDRYRIISAVDIVFTGI